MRLSQGLILVAGVVSLGLGLLLIAMVWQFSVAVPYLSGPLAVLLLGAALGLIILSGLLLLRAKRGRGDP
jgi:hypothetical protein